MMRRTRPFPFLRLCFLMFILSFLSVLVAAQPYHTGAVLLTEDPVVGEEILFRISGEPASVRIETPTTEYRHLGVPENPLSFTSSEPGEHHLLLLDASLQVMSDVVFHVRDRNGTIPETRAPDSTDLLVVGPDGERVAVTVRQRSVFERKGLLALSLPFGETEIVHNRIGAFTMRGVTGGRLGLDTPSKRGLRIGDKTIRDAFAVDPTSLDFIDGELRRVATGTELYKCKEWNFSEQRCYGSWTKIMDLVPGEEYVIDIGPEDPGFAETGVATVNSVKPVYAPGEKAELLMAVLDTEGYLVPGANVELEITRPDNLTIMKSTDDDSIMEVSPGIYRAETYNTALEGRYGLLVTAVGAGVNMTMRSHFDVRSGYLFDIFRDVPMSIDPWRGPFESTIRVENHDANETNVTVIEKLPLDLAVTDRGAASLSSTNASQFLTWSSIMPGTNLSYYAQAPYVAPDLYTLGEITVLGTSGNQTEARPWYLAIDPSDTLTPIVDTNTALQGTPLTASEVAAITTDNTTYVTFTKNEELTVELSDPANATPIESVSSLSCSVTYTSENYDSAATFRIDDSFGGNALGSTTLPASVGSDSTVTLSDLQNDADFDIADLTTLNIYVRNNDGGKPQTISVDYVRCSVTYAEADIEDPVVTLDVPNEGDFFSTSSIDFNFTPSDNIALDDCRLYIDGVLNQTMGSPVNGTINSFSGVTIGEGSHNWTVNCNDTSNNVGWASETRNFTVDVTSPSSFTLSSPANDTVSTDLTPTFTWTATTETNFKNYTLILDDDPGFGSPNYVEHTYNLVTNTTYTFTSVVASNTKYYWKVVAYDEAGWSTESSVDWIYITDTLLPSVFNLVSPADGTVSSDVTPFLDWGSTTETNFANYTVQFDDDPGFGSIDHTYYSFNLPSNSSYQILGGESLTPNTLLFWRVIAYDRAGQSRTSTSIFNYTVDTIAPNISLEAPSPGYTETLTNTIEFNYSVTDVLSDVSSCQLIINGTVEQTHSSVPEGSTQTFSEYLDNGNYEWWVNCTDGVGNVNESIHRFLTVSVTVDSTAPVITPNSPGIDAYLNYSTVTFNYTVQDSTGIQNCSLYLDGALNRTNGSVVNNQQNHFTVTGISEAQHSWFINCFDNSTSFNEGNSSSRNFTIDVTAPTTFNLLFPVNDTRTNDPVMLLNWSQTTETHFGNYTVLLDNNSDFSSPEYEYSTSTITETDHTSGALADDWYYWKVIAYDLAGNKRVSTQTWRFQIRTQAPTFLNVTEFPLDPVEYNPNIMYNFTMTLDEPELDTVYFAHDFFGSFQNYTPTGDNGTTFYYQITGLNVSDYQYEWFANDTVGNENYTGVYLYNVTKNATTVTLQLDGISDNVTINESTIVNLTGSLNWPASGNVQIRKNGSLLIQNTSTATTLHNFTIPGFYIINASYSGGTNYFSSWAAWYVTVLDNYAPNVTLISPGDGDTDPDGIVSYAYKVSDTNDIVNCTLYINGTENGTEPSVVKDTTLYFNRVYDVNQNLTWQVRCFDAAGREGNSSVYNLTIQINQYTENLVPIACSDANGCTPGNMNVSDTTWEDHGILSKNPRNNYVYANVTLAGIPLGAEIINVTIGWDKYQSTGSGTFFLTWRNGSNWQPICSQGFTASSTATPDPLQCAFPTFPNVTTFNDGLNLRANFYYAGNPSGQTFETNFVQVNVTYEEDVTPPTVSLNDPPNDEELGAGDIEFNFTPSDKNLYNCSLYGDFNGSWELNQSINLSDGLTSGVENSFPSIYLDPGYYTWNVLCFDIANNSAFAGENYSVNITPPDLTTYTNNITLNESVFRESLNVTVNATIFNTGYTEATNFLVQFWLGDPDVGGVQLGDNISILSLPGFSYTFVDTSFLMQPGPNHIFVVIDPDDRIEEVSELNNEANRTFNVDAYHTYYGSVNATITLDTASNETLKGFNSYNATGNLFFVRSGTDISWADLGALGRNNADIPTSDDFTNADVLLNMTGFNDSINARWANNTDTPLATDVFDVRNDTIPNVPVVYSDASGNFTTGILWDTSKDNSSNTEYDTSDKEPIVFVTNIIQDRGSDYGIDDYVVDVPAYLRSYAGQPTETITIYYELK